MTRNNKRCPKCGKTKPIEAIYKNKSRYDGHYATCKECTRNRISLHVAYKECNRCGVTESVDKFRKDPSKKDGRYNICKKCETAKRANTIIRTHKTCCVCGIDQPIAEFYKNSVRSDGHASQCRKCSRSRHKYVAVDSKTCSCCDELKSINMFPIDKGRIDGHRNICKQCRNHKTQKRMRNDPAFRMQHRMSIAVYHALRAKKAGRHWEDLVGYTVHELMEHLEKQFKPGMSWDNYGEWHIDHIIPRCKFDVTLEDGMRECWKLDNLQPLWAMENLIKGAN